MSKEKDKEKPKEKSKKKKAGRSLYKVEKSGTVTSTRRPCPRCEKGTYMAEHFNRFACGRCGFTEFKRKS